MTFKRIDSSWKSNKNLMKKRRKSYKKKNFFFIRFIKKLILLSLFWFIIIWWIFWIILYQKYIKDLPSVKELWNLKIAKSSIIYDKKWNELYKIYKENRTYINYGNISNNMINAIVAWEDKRFFTNPWVDLVWIFRAFIYYAIWKTKKLEWTSTISQQLIRNTIITNERKIERKIKEIYLSYKMTKWLSKEKILELYLNKISFWSNAYGIEQASNTFFNKKAKELNILESSILASLPKWPSYYSPYNNPDRLLWYPYIYPTSDNNSITKIITKKDIKWNEEKIKTLKSFIQKLKLKRLSESKALICWFKKGSMKNNLSIDKDGCSIMDYSDLLVTLNSIKLESNNEVIEYQTWRKDFILWRMLEDNYINFDQYKLAIINSFTYNFSEYKENIKYPHFVFYVREYLENKYWSEILEKWWLQIYTSIDPKLQDKAIELIKKYSKINKEKFNAQNAALISIHNETWEILSMVWGKDYFDKENQWNVNIITSRLQPGSTFKPFVYALAMENNAIWTTTPVYDLRTNFPWNYSPSNFDWKFEGKMTLATALNHSRNIPAIKMFFMAWWEKIIIKFMKILWVNTLWDFKKEYYNNHKKSYTYGATMALWTWLMTPLELAKAYSIFANMWKDIKINPIIKIVDSKWLIIEDIWQKNEKKQVISPVMAYIINYILSNTSFRPEFWNNYLTIKWRSVSAKTWTSTKQYRKWWKDYIFPRNLWTIWYTPQITTVVWVGNTDWKELNYKWNWLEWAWPIWKDFMTFAHKWKNIKTWKSPNKVKNVKISSISGLLPKEWMEKNFIKSSLFINSPIEYDNSLWITKIDALCNWKITENTPPAAIKEVNLLTFHSLKPNNINWENPVKEWVKKWFYKKEYWNIQNIITELNDKICERDSLESNIEIKSTIKSWDIFVNWSNYIELAYRSSHPIIRLDIFIWENKISNIKINSKLKWVYKWVFSIPTWYYWKYNLKIMAVDSNYFSNEEIKEIWIVKKDKNPPKINMINPTDEKIILYKWDFFNLRWKIEERTSIRSINIYLDNNPLKIWMKNRNFKYPIESENIKIWKHIITIEAVDSDFKIWKKEIELEVIKK